VKLIALRTIGEFEPGWNRPGSLKLLEILLKKFERAVPR